MNVYKLSMVFEDDNLEDGIGWENEYLVHAVWYSQEEFEDICEKAKEICKEKYNEVLNYTMMIVLKEHFGFSSLNVMATYNYEEEFR
ncbi:hypothetical protein QTH49_13440 [Clostridium perfringens]|nr:hypothetical protein [Clostridium perfringens]